MSMKHTPSQKARAGLPPEAEAQKMVGFRIPADDFERCVTYAIEQRRTHSSFIRMLALKGLEHFESERQSETRGRRKRTPK